MKKKISLSTTVALVVLAIALTVTLTMKMAVQYFNNQLHLVGERQAMYTHINTVDKVVRTYYPDLDEEALRQAIAQGYVYGLGDTYAAYYTPARYTAEVQRLAGKATNVGLSLCLNAKGEIAVGRVHTDSAAGKAGVQVGDVLTAVNDQPITGKSLSELQTLVTSAEKVLISVLRGEESLAYEMSAYQYTVRTVESQVLDTVGYVKISAFYDNTPEQFQAALDALQAQGVQGLIFDLRNNAGGLPEAVQEMLSHMLPIGAYGTTTDTAGAVTKLASTMNDQLGLPTVTLVNSGTVGEAEFFAGVLQEFSLTTVVGQTTAGKAKFQSYFPLEADSSALRLTVGEYGLLKGGSWQGVGIVPTVESMLPPEQAMVYQLLTPEQDAQVQVAVGQILNPTPQFPMEPNLPGNTTGSTGDATDRDTTGTGTNTTDTDTEDTSTGTGGKTTTTTGRKTTTDDE